MTLDVIWSIDCFVVRVMRILSKRLRLESRGFRCNVAFSISYLHIKLDYEIGENPLELRT